MKAKKLSRKGTIMRSRIIHAAMKVFAAYGFKGASTSIIAKEAGIESSHIFIYFKSKKELYLTVLEKFTKDQHKFIFNPYYFSIKNDPELQVRTLLSNWILFLAHNPDYLRLYRWEISNGNSFLLQLKSKPLISKDPFTVELYKVLCEGVDKGVFNPTAKRVETFVSLNNICFGLFVRMEFFQELGLDVVKLAKADANYRNYIIDLCLKLVKC
ncbi:TetR/AcrR family transcriptional regulator [Desulfallas thermosapovorans]|uniref:TetR family transcriptional regulator n=1 Tax=Desulfallas thermosapovorans DSM 6562 TaxID=1121431 RepID=A0A5S4ZR65_9FIRM|nr:TetR/AcrR family transcriptional regulator [Desulfallas thermosapovorans]TYO95113.1 TetR family transcriptional regulator [Desulfallas thermosapovorans DSM 6562]